MKISENTSYNVYISNTAFFRNCPQEWNDI
jgi:hypothetical protein